MKLAGTRGRLARPHTPRPGLPTPPDWLSSAALREWNRLAPLLAEQGLLARLDADVFAEYCQLLPRLAALWRKLDNEGDMIEVRGRLQRNPTFTQLLTISRKVHDLGTRLGMSPLARARLNRCN